MATFLLRRILAALPVAFIVSILAFLLMYFSPGDPAVHAAGGVDATEEGIRRAREYLGLNDPMWVQYWKWLSGVLQGDFGTSFFRSTPVMDEIVQASAPTVSLAVVAMVMAVMTAIPLGFLAAIYRGSWLDRAITGYATIGIAAPSFFVGLLLVSIISLDWKLLPATGYVPFADNPIRWLQHLILPGISLGLILSAELTRHFRSALLDVLSQDYVRTAIAKGLPTWKILLKHTAKNAAIPVVTVFGLQLRFILGATVVIESVFALPGLGMLMIRSAFNHDYRVLQAIAIVFVVTVLIINILVDLSYAYFNPRVRSR